MKDPRRLYVNNDIYTILGDYEFTDKGVRFHGHKGYNLIRRKKVKNLEISLTEIKWLEYSNLEGANSMSSLTVELQNYLYRKWGSVNKKMTTEAHTEEDRKNWSEYYKKERDSILKK